MWWRRFGGPREEYVPVARRVSQAASQAAKRAKKAGRKPEPVKIEGRGIATTFWGQSWCKNLEHYSDISNRLPRGKTYARNGSVADLVVNRGRVEAIVAGSMVYDVTITISPIASKKWQAIKRDCATSIGSLIDLLSGRLADDVMDRLVKPGDGMFPSPGEIKVKCSCPDGAYICKHLAAVFYGIGNRLDTKPELLFLLRGVDQKDLVSAATKESVSQAVRGSGAHALADDDLSSIFGIDMGATGARKPQPKAKKAAVKATVKKKPAVKKNAVKKPVAKRKPAAARKVAERKHSRRVHDR